MRAAIVANVTAPYRTELFRHMHPLLDDLCVYFQADSEPLRTWERRPQLPYRHTFLENRALWLGPRRIGLYADLTTRLIAEAPDVIVGYGFSVAVLQSARYARGRGIPFVIACDSTIETDPCSGPEYLYRRVLVGMASGFIAASSNAADYFEVLGAPRDAIDVVELTCDLVAIRDASIPQTLTGELERKLGGTGNVVVLAARLVRDKRILEACEAILTASSRVPDIRLAIAGDGPLRAELERWIRRRGGDHVVSLGLLPWDQMLALYHRSALSVFTAVREKFGMVVIEALAAGVPVVAYRKSGAVRDLIRNGINGYAVDEGDVSSLAMRIADVLEDRSLLEEMRRNARQVVDSHDVRVEARKFVDALETVARGSRAISIPEQERMKMLSLNVATGRVSRVEGDHPARVAGSLLVRNRYSLISSGTERTKIDLAGSSLWQKARARPDQVAKVLTSVQREGMLATAQMVHDRLNTPQLLGYSTCGIVLEVGEGCDEFRRGMAVACGGASACHAEVISVPRNLVVPVPTGVDLRHASYATVASIALHGLRTGGVSIGDRVLVIGLGLIGQLTVRLCRAAGAHVFGVDPRADRADLALASGAERADCALDESTSAQVMDWTQGRGADVVLITAGGGEGTPLHLAGASARDRARVVVIGAVGLDVPRELFYEKELSLVISRSYGPGRYDADYEEKGMAYPVGFVPWTERRNMSEILTMLQKGALDLQGLHGETVPFANAPEAYELLSDDKAGSPPIAIVLDYGSAPAPTPPQNDVSGNGSEGTSVPAQGHRPQAPRISFLGLGKFASGYLLPAIRSVRGIPLEWVVTATPLKAESARKRAGFRSGGTSANAALDDKGTTVLFIATRHDTHALYAEAALRAGKAVFVEKPLALTAEELERVASAIRSTQGRLMVGFNRRFAPATRYALGALGSNRAGLRFLCRVNAGALPHDHWLLDPHAGGGRLLGEGCHFIDLAAYVADSAPIQIQAHALDAPAHDGMAQSSRIEITFANGATAGIDYLAGGDASLSKERVEIHRSGTSIVIDDFQSVAVHRAGKRRVRRWARRDKGHRAEVRAFLEAVRTGGETPIPEEQSLLSTALTLAAARSIREGRPLTREEW